MARFKGRRWQTTTRIWKRSEKLSTAIQKPTELCYCRLSDGVGALADTGGDTDISSLGALWRVWEASVYQILKRRHVQTYTGCRAGVSISFITRNHCAFIGVRNI